MKNIPTEHGEIRCQDQYVVAAGSHVLTSEEEILKANIPQEVKDKILQDKDLGVYTLEKEILPSSITDNQIPGFFLEREKQTEKELQEKAVLKTTTIKPIGKHSALFDLRITDVVSISKNRVAHPLHDSDTGMNFSIRDGLSFCWRHNVSLNALQFLVVKSGYMSCLDAGTGTAKSGAGPSKVNGDDGAIFHAWLQAKQDGLIPKDDPIPTRAMEYIAVKHKLIPSDFEGMLPTKIYNQVIKLLEDGDY